MTQKVLRVLVWELSGNKSVCSAADVGLVQDLPFPWRRKWQPNPVFLPEESHGQRSLAGYTWWGLKESDVTVAT